MPWSEQGLEKEKCLAAAHLFVRTVLPFFVLETAESSQEKMLSVVFHRKPWSPPTGHLNAVMEGKVSL